MVDKDIIDAFRNEQPTYSAANGRYVSRSGGEFKHRMQEYDTSLHRVYNNTDTTNLPDDYDVFNFCDVYKGQVLYYRNKFTHSIDSLTVADVRNGCIYFIYHDRLRHVSTDAVGSRLYYSASSVPGRMSSRDYLTDDAPKEHKSMERMPSGGIYKSPLEE